MWKWISGSGLWVRPHLDLEEEEEEEEDLEENSPTGAIFLQLQLSFVFLQSDGGQAKNYTKKLFVGEALPILVAHITVMRLGATTTIIL